MPVHVFGHVSDVEGIQKLADKYNLKVIYDAAHAFGAKYKNKSLLRSHLHFQSLSFSKFCIVTSRTRWHFIVFV